MVEVARIAKDWSRSAKFLAVGFCASERSVRFKRSYVSENFTLDRITSVAFVGFDLPSQSFGKLEKSWNWWAVAATGAMPVP